MEKNHIVIKNLVMFRGVVFAYFLRIDAETAMLLFWTNLMSNISTKALKKHQILMPD